MYLTATLLRTMAGTLDYSAAFELFDVDDDGNATPDELRAIFVRCACVILKYARSVPPGVAPLNPSTVAASAAGQPLYWGDTKYRKNAPCTDCLSRMLFLDRYPFS